MIARLARFAAVLGWTVSTLCAQSPRVEFTWPTPHPAWNEGRPAASFLQHAGSGDPASGGFGGVRSGGTKFHEGIDIPPVARDRRGEATDDIFAAMAGVVRHINASAGDSGYGRYVVLEHPEETPGVYTLYAHLAKIAPGLRVGERVQRGVRRGVRGVHGLPAGHGEAVHQMDRRRVR